MESNRYLLMGYQPYNDLLQRSTMDVQNNCSSVPDHFPNFQGVAFQAVKWLFQKLRIDFSFQNNPL